MNFEIRILKKHDLNFLKDMVYESAFVPEGQKPFPRIILDEPSVSKFFDGWQDQIGDIGLIAIVKDQQIGAIWLRLFDDNEIPEIGMAILKEFRGYGIGNELMREIEIQAMNYGYEKLCLSVDPRNRALTLYEKLGYVQVGWDDSFWIMEKVLASENSN